MANIPNDNLYYKLELFVDPGETNSGRLHDLLLEKESEWKKRINNSPKYKSFCEQSKQWREQLGSISFRLKRMMNEARDARLSELRTCIANFEGDGILEASEYDYLVKIFSKYFTEETIKSHLTLSVSDSVEYKIPEPYQAPADIEPVPDATMNSIKMELEIINQGINGQKTNHQNLYELIGCHESTDVRTLSAKVSEMLLINHNRPDKTAAGVCAEGKLLGIALTIFKSENTKRGYDYSLVRVPISEFKQDGGAWYLRAVKKSVKEAEYIASIQEALALGLNRAEAEWLVYEYYCKRRKCPFPFDTTSREKREKAQKLLEEIRNFIVEGQLEDTEKRLIEVETLMPDSPEAEAFRLKIQQYRDEARKRETEINTLEDEIHKAVQRHRFYKAVRLLAELRALRPDSPLFSHEAELVETTLTTVNQKLLELEKTVENPRRISLCEDILALAADCPEAKTIMDKIPPDPPSELKAKETAGGIELTWNASPSRYLTGYLIIRKVGAVPSSVHDGDILMDGTVNTRFTDTKADVGTVYGYAVWTKRDRITDRDGCYSNLAQLVGDVANVRILPGNQSMTLRWSKIPASVGAVVTRWKNSVNHGRGTEIRLMNKTTFVDSGLENGTCYAYKIQSVFCGVDGDERLSDGVVITGTPQPPPKPVNDLRVTFNQENVMLEWTPPARGTLYLFCHSDAPDRYSGAADYTTLEEVKKKFEEMIPIVEPASGKTVWKTNRMGVCYFLPVTMDGGIAVFGKYVTKSRVCDIERIDIQMNDDDIYLSWLWPHGIEDVVVQWRRDAFPTGPDDPQSQKFRLLKSDYDKLGDWHCPAKLHNSFLILYSYLPQNGLRSEGVRLYLGKTILKYDLMIQGKKRNSVKAFLNIRKRSGPGGIPELTLIKGAGQPPLSRDFGEWIMSIPATPKEQMTVSIPLSHFGRDQYVALFTADENDEIYYEYDAPPPEKLRLELPVH